MKVAKAVTVIPRSGLRKHAHFLVTIYYPDGEKFGRVYTDKQKAMGFAERQRRSPMVKSVRIREV